MLGLVTQVGRGLDVSEKNESSKSSELDCHYDKMKLSSTPFLSQPTSANLFSFFPTEFREKRGAHHHQLKSYVPSVFFE